MDAVEDLSRLDDAARGAVAKPRQGIAFRPIDSGQPQDREPVAGDCPPSGFRGEPRLRPRAVRRGLGVLVDPAAMVIAIDPDGGEIDHARRSAPQRFTKRRQHGIASRTRRHRDQQDVGLAGAGGNLRVMRCVIKQMHVEAAMEVELTELLALLRAAAPCPKSVRTGRRKDREDASCCSRGRTRKASLQEPIALSDGVGDLGRPRWCAEAEATFPASDAQQTVCRSLRFALCRREWPDCKIALARAVN